MLLEVAGGRGHVGGSCCTITWFTVNVVTGTTNGVIIKNQVMPINTKMVRVIPIFNNFTDRFLVHGQGDAINAPTPTPDSGPTTTSSGEGDATPGPTTTTTTSTTTTSTTTITTNTATFKTRPLYPSSVLVAGTVPIEDWIAPKVECSPTQMTCHVPTKYALITYQALEPSIVSTDGTDCDQVFTSISFDDPSSHFHFERLKCGATRRFDNERGVMVDEIVLTPTLAAVMSSLATFWGAAPAVYGDGFGGGYSFITSDYSQAVVAPPDIYCRCETPAQVTAGSHVSLATTSTTSTTTTTEEVETTTTTTTTTVVEQGTYWESEQQITMDVDLDFRRLLASDETDTEEGGVFQSSTHGRRRLTLSQNAARVLSNAVAEGMLRACCSAIQDLFSSIEECMVGQKSTQTGFLNALQATMSFAIDDDLLSAAGAIDLGSGVYQQPYFPFDSQILTAPDGHSHHAGFPFPDGSSGMAPLRRLGGRAEQPLRRLQTVENTATFRVQATSPEIMDTVISKLNPVTGMGVQIKTNAVLSTHTFGANAITPTEATTFSMAVGSAATTVSTPSIRFFGTTTTTTSTTTTTTTDEPITVTTTTTTTSTSTTTTIVTVPDDLPASLYSYMTFLYLFRADTGKLPGPVPLAMMKYYLELFTPDPAQIVTVKSCRAAPIAAELATSPVYFFQDYCEVTPVSGIPMEYHTLPESATHMGRVSFPKFKFTGYMAVFFQCHFVACTKQPWGQPCGACGTGDASGIQGTGWSEASEVKLMPGDPSFRVAYEWPSGAVTVSPPSGNVDLFSR